MDSYYKTLVYILYIIGTIYAVWFNKKLHAKAIGLDNKVFAFGLCITLILIAVILNVDNILPNKEDNDKLKEATRKAFMALLIAMFARLDLVLSPCYLVFVFTFLASKQWL
jgi:hypothetical protein